LSARTTVAIWKQPYDPATPPLGTFSLERAAELTGLSTVWLGFVLHSKTAAFLSQNTCICTEACQFPNKT